MNLQSEKSNRERHAGSISFVSDVITSLNGGD